MMKQTLLITLVAGACMTTLFADPKKADDPLYEFAAEPTFQDNFDAGWEQTQKNWRVATWKQNKTLMDKDRCQTNGEGMMVQTVLPELPGKGGSMETKIEFPYGRWVARVKPTAVPGVLNSIFTKDWDDKTTDEPGNDGGGSEVDIEFLTSMHQKNSAKVHFAIHLGGRPNHYTHYQEVDFNPSDNFHEWGFDILPDRVDWHVDGKILHTWYYTEDAKIDENYEFFFNSWTMKNWIQGPPPEKAEYFIDWVKFFPIKK